MTAQTDGVSTPAPHRGTRPTRLHHNAYVTTDLEATRHFYEDLIGLPLTATWAEVDELPDRTRVYCHTFFELADGSALAFFQFANTDGEIPPVFQASNSVHIALNCDSETQEGIKERLLADGYTTDDMVVRDHGYCDSLYIRDPNGLRLEFTVDRPEMPKISVEKRSTAHEDLAKWLAGDHSSNNTYR
jgi:glyoxylase I family protein